MSPVYSAIDIYNSHNYSITTVTDTPGGGEGHMNEQWWDSNPQPRTEYCAGQSVRAPLPLSHPTPHQFLDHHRLPNKQKSSIFDRYLLHPMYSFIFFLSPGDYMGWLCLWSCPGKVFYWGTARMTIEGHWSTHFDLFLIDLFFDRLPAVCPTGVVFMKSPLTECAPRQNMFRSSLLRQSTCVAT